MNRRSAACITALVSAAIALVCTACKNHQSSASGSAADEMRAAAQDRENRFKKRLEDLATRHSAFRLAAAFSDDVFMPTTYDVQNAVQEAQDKPVVFAGFLSDVYRQNDQNRAVFVMMDEPLNATVILDVTNDQAKQLAKNRHDLMVFDYGVVAGLLKVSTSCVPGHIVTGEEGDDLEDLTVEHSGIEIELVLTGKLLEYVTDK